MLWGFFAARVGCAEGDQCRASEEDARGKQGASVSGGERVGPCRVRGEQMIATCGGERGEDCESECGPQLRRRVEQSGGEAGLVGRNPSIGGDGGADDDRAEPALPRGRVPGAGRCFAIALWSIHDVTPKAL